MAHVGGVELNVQTPCTNAGIHCFTNSSVDRMGEGKLILLGSMEDASNELSLP